MIDSMDLGFWVVGEPNRALTERTCVEGYRTEQEKSSGYRIILLQHLLC